MSNYPAWLNAIHDPATYPHPVSEVRLLETHISWIILTGDWAYKLKKPVNFGFVNFSTLELRRQDCHEEVRLNRRTAPALYDDVVPLAEDVDGPQFGGAGKVIEYAVRMKQFRMENLLEQFLRRGELSIEIIDSLALQVADLHRHAEIAPKNSPFGSPEIIRNTVQACFDILNNTQIPEALKTTLRSINEWFKVEGNRLQETFIARKEQGWIRECHGDLHLGNIVLYRGKPTLFDCLEFNPELRWIDIFNDIAFLIMDLLDHDASHLAWRTLNQWLERIGDYEGISVLKYYMAYRAIVRAKVAAICLQQPELSDDEKTRQHKHLESYIELAKFLIRKRLPSITLMNGFSGSGKSFVASQLCWNLDAIQIRSDIERKRLLNRWPDSSQTETLIDNPYSSKVTEKTYLRLQTLARTMINAGYPVVVDATFLKRSDRNDFAKIAEEVNVPLQTIVCRAPVDVLYERVQHRAALKRDASDAEETVLRQQLMNFEPLDPSELKTSITLDTSSENLPLAILAIQDQIRH